MQLNLPWFRAVLTLDVGNVRFPDRACHGWLAEEGVFMELLALVVETVLVMRCGYCCPPSLRNFSPSTSSIRTVSGEQGGFSDDRYMWLRSDSRDVGCCGYHRGGRNVQYEMSNLEDSKCIYCLLVSNILPLFQSAHGWPQDIFSCV